MDNRDFGLEISAVLSSKVHKKCCMKNVIIQLSHLSYWTDDTRRRSLDPVSRVLKGAERFTRIRILVKVGVNVADGTEALLSPSSADI